MPLFNLNGQVTIPSNCAKEAVLLYSIPECNRNAYELVLEDNFDGNKLDTSVWELPCCFYGGLQGSQHVEYNTLDNVSISEGVCKITAKKETVLRRITFWYDSAAIMEDGLPNLRTFDYTSGSMWTKKKFFHGKFEARCRMPSGKGLWPAFWLYGGKRNNEIDIFDSYSGTDKLVTNLLHDYDGNQKSYGCVQSFGGYDFTQWHIFACVFDFDKISFLVDDKLVRVVHRIVNQSGQPIECGNKIAPGTYFFLKSYPVEQMRLILNLALTSSNGPAGSIAVDETTPLPAVFEIDYVKVWEQGDGKENITLLPNPSSDKITVISDYIIKSLRINTISGLSLYNELTDAKEVSINISEFPAGVYFISAEFEGSVRTSKLVKLSGD